MLDIKAPTPFVGDVVSPPSEEFLRRIGALLANYGFARSSCVNSTSTCLDLARPYLPPETLTALTARQWDQAREGSVVQLDGRFWFGVPDELPDSMISVLQESRALVIPAINSFQYPAHADRILARLDIERLRKAGIDGFQIDSVYEPFFQLD